VKVLITGGCGFLGSNLAADALECGDEVTIFDNLSRHGSVLNLHWLQRQGQFEFVHGDIRNSNDVAKLVRAVKPDAVFHLAGQVAMTTSIADPRLDFETNALGTIHLLEGVRTHAANAMVLYSSTNKVYGDLEQYTYEETATRYRCLEFPDGFPEATPLEFHSPYGCSKGSADQYMLDYARMFDLNTIVLRHSSMYGGRQFATYDQGWVGWFCKKALEARRNQSRDPITISGTGKQVRDVLHAADMKRLYRAVVRNAERARGQVFNIGGGIDNSLSLLELFRVLEEILGVELRYSRLAPRQSDQRVFVADISKARKVLGWQPAVSAPQGVAQMCDWLSGSE
jgi:CDP-paratose 2-epimerase